jgi:2,3-bisphosphoglycerate-independent phosphoglycerate mutase
MVNFSAKDDFTSYFLLLPSHETRGRKGSRNPRLGVHNLNERKLVYILLDGVGDRADESKNNTTPLERAKTPNLDSLTSRSKLGLVQTVGKGIAPESDIAVFSMLGYRFSNDYCGRGVVEAVGCGVEFSEGQLALRANFATLIGRSIVDRRAGRGLSDAEGRELSEGIAASVKLSDPNADFEFVHTVGYRAVLVLRHRLKKLSSNISNTDSAYVKVGGIGVARENLGESVLEKSIPLDSTESSRISADLVNEFTDKSLQFLEEHPINRQRLANFQKPANGILLRDAGDKLPSIETLERRFGYAFSCLVDMPVEKGIGKLTGMKSIDSTREEPYDRKADKAIAALDASDIVYVHIKGPDEPGHDGDFDAKTMVIERIDSEFFGSLLLHREKKKFSIALSADHSTPCSLKAHSSDPVPLMVYDPAATSGADETPGKRFTEKSASKGQLGLMEGPDVLPTILSLTGM